MLFILYRLWLLRMSECMMGLRERNSVRFIESSEGVVWNLDAELFFQYYCSLPGTYELPFIKQLLWKEQFLNILQLLANDLGLLWEKLKTILLIFVHVDATGLMQTANDFCNLGKGHSGLFLLTIFSISEHHHFIKHRQLQLLLSLERCNLYKVTFSYNFALIKLFKEISHSRLLKLEFLDRTRFFLLWEGFGVFALFTLLGGHS